MSLYDVVIIDDEFMMRDGLKNLINWEDLGYRVVNVFDDGAKGIEWLKENRADVVLTDLKMGAVSGIDVARYIHEKKNNTKVIIISGYSDFNAAQQAMELKVDNYLLKPISIKRIKDVLERISDELSRYADNNHNIEMDAQDEYLEGCFAEDLMSGVLKNKGRINKYVKMLGWEHVSKAPCALITLNARDKNIVMREFDGDVEAMNDFIWGIFKRNSRFYPLKQANGNLLGLLLDTTDAAEQCRTIINSLNTIIDIKIELINVLTFRNLDELTEAWPYPWHEQNESISLLQIRERQQIVMTYLLKNDLEQAQSHYHAFLSILDAEIGFVKSASIDFFAGIVERLRSENKLWEQDVVFPYNLLCEATTQEELRTCGARLIDELALKALIFKSFNKNAIVSKACEFIEQNYSGVISLEQTAAHLFISPVYLSRIFKEAIGINFKNYVIDKKIGRACELLAQGDSIKVYEVCKLVGYNDVKYFYQVFSKKMNCTPMEYKARYQSHVI